jgi:hypothetical protein
VSEGIGAYISPVSRSGLVALYRLARAGNWDRLYTMSAVERDSAAGLGYTSEGIAGYRPVVSTRRNPSLLDFRITF